MTARMKRIHAVKGFMPTTYAVYVGAYVVKIYPKRQDAERLVAEINDMDETPDYPCFRCKDLPLARCGSCNKGYGICKAYLDYQAAKHEGGNH